MAANLTGGRWLQQELKSQERIGWAPSEANASTIRSAENFSSDLYQILT
jgi:hypothetical protein